MLGGGGGVAAGGVWGWWCGLLGCGVWVLWVLVVGGVLAVGGLLVGLLVFFDF